MGDLSYFKLSKSKLAETEKNADLSDCLVKSIKFHQPDQHKLVMNLCSQSFPYSILHNVIVKFIFEGKISGGVQIDEAIGIIKEFRSKIPVDQDDDYAVIENLVNNIIGLDDIKKRCGVGILIEDTQVQTFVDSVIEKNNTVPNLKPVILKEIRNDPFLRFGNIPAMMKIIDKNLKNYKPKVAHKLSEKSIEEKGPFDFLKEGDISKLHKAGQNPQINPDLMKQHLKETNGLVMTRFPPEPNGFLHLGHAKAININFGYAKLHNGKCYLRYDDTNPDAEDQIYFDGILEMVQWLGFEPFKVTHSSDNFDKLYELAVLMIKRDKAYVDHSTGEEMYEQRGGEAKGPRSDSKYRSRPISESLLEFENMKNGKYEEGKATLRLKMDMQSPNPYFWDPVAYRIIKSKTHERTKDKWCIYPTYDFTHCICDSVENITHSLCTTEFVHARESYYWILDALELYKPVQWEYGRLNITGTVTSKRKVVELVKIGAVKNWDDPRLFTLIALRRRGVPADAINTFVRQLGVTTSLTTIESVRFDQVVRDHLNSTAPRCFAVLKPLKIKLINVPDDFLIKIDNVSMLNGSHLSRTLYFGKEIAIDTSDFVEDADENFYRLRKGYSVGLLQVPFPITCVRVTGDGLECRYDDPSFPNCNPEIPYEKLKSYIQWVNPAHAISVDINDYDNLFKHPDPSDKQLVPQGYLSDINYNSLNVQKGLIELGALEACINSYWKPTKEYKRCQLTATAMAEHHYYTEKLKFQFVRMGYYQVDPSSDFTALFENQLKSVKNDLLSSSVVFNKTVSLKEDSRKA
eukprot:NODE_76_length_23837_cov_1.242396.p3 type:complete len:802 gc:universal NODE_76_length_23837_cov_1.242396:5430-3025(-)